MIPNGWSQNGTFLCSCVSQILTIRMCLPEKAAKRIGSWLVLALENIRTQLAYSCLYADAQYLCNSQMTWIFGNIYCKHSFLLITRDSVTRNTWFNSIPTIFNGRINFESNKHDPGRSVEY